LNEKPGDAYLTEEELEVGKAETENTEKNRVVETAKMVDFIMV
jgi:hypothetical protein